MFPRRWMTVLSMLLVAGGTAASARAGEPAPAPAQELARPLEPAGPAAPGALPAEFALPAAAQPPGAAPAGVSQLVYAAPLAIERRQRLDEPREGSGARAAPRAGLALGPERARILLRSLTVPGWGQATLGHRHAGAVFGAIDLGIWTAFAAFEVQQRLRISTSLRTAQIDAGIDLSSRDEEFRRIVGSFLSSDDYNLFVVTRDAANLYLLDPQHPDMAGYRAYIAAHSLAGADGWTWTDLNSLLRYRGERKNAERASLRANTALALAIANRLVSALHAARLAGRPEAGAAHTRTSWGFEVGAPSAADPTAVRAGLRARF